MSAIDFLVARSLPFVPRPVVRRVSRRYIAGDRLEDAVVAVRRLNAGGLLATLDVLGESVTRPDLAEGAVRDYLEALRAIGAERLDSNISVKLTQLGLKIDPALCLMGVRRLVTAAREQGNLVRLDMEDSSCTTPTLDIFRRLLAEGFTNVGIVLQACMRRSLADLRSLPRGTNIRLCKGIYIEPRVIAFRDRELVRKNFVRLLDEMFDRECYAGIATHDEDLVWEAERLIDRRGLPRHRYEFQTLLGVDEELRGLIGAADHRLRVYVPFGANWYAYSVRRLRENPSIAGYVIRATLAGRT